MFIDNVPSGFVAGRDYVSVVAADNYGNGVASAHLMAQALDGKGTVGMVEHKVDFFVTRQRADAFEATIAENYPGMRIVGREGVSGPGLCRRGRGGRRCAPCRAIGPRRDLGCLGCARDGCPVANVKRKQDHRDRVMQDHLPMEWTWVS